jgi:glutathione S-transferase
MPYPKHQTDIFPNSGIPPNDSKAPGYFADYSSPAIQFADGSKMQDSWPIAHELEKRYPSPSLHLDDPIVVQVRDHIPEMMGPLRGVFIPKVPVVLLNKRSADYFNETREKAFGMPLSEVEKQLATDEQWEKARVPAEKAGEWLRKNGGPFFLGEKVSYADFILVGMMTMMQRIDQGLFERFLAFDPAFPKLFEASKQWLEKDD